MLRSHPTSRRSGKRASRLTRSTGFTRRSGLPTAASCFLLVLERWGAGQRPAWSRLHLVESRTGAHVTKDFIFSSFSLSGRDTVSYSALKVRRNPDARTARRSSYRVGSLFGRSVPFLHFEVTRREIPGQDFGESILYAVKGEARERVPAFQFRGGSPALTSDRLGYAQEPHLSPDGRWLFVVTKVCRGESQAFLYRRTGDTLRFRLIDGRRSFREAIHAHYSRIRHLSRRTIRRLETWQMVHFDGWDRRSKRLNVLYNAGDPEDRRRVELWPVSYDLVRGRFAR
jgi:hypothetical protein